MDRRSVDRGVISQIDRPLVAVVVILTGLGLYNLSSAAQPVGADLHHSQSMYVLIGALTAIGIASFHYRNLEVLALPIFIGAVLLLIGTDVFGKVVNGSRRWLPLGPVNVQTSDLAKLAVMVIIARMFHLERVGSGLTLRELARPMNISRPFLVVVAVLAVSLLGDQVSPPKIQRMIGNHSRRVASLTKEKPLVTVGRLRDNDVRLNYEGVAEKHAEIVRIEDGQYEVRDLGSETGVFVNGERITGERPLKNGDTIRFGLSTRSEVTLKAQIEKVRPVLPFIAIFGFIWLIAAIIYQLKKGAWSVRDFAAPIDVVLLPVGLVLAQPDLGTALIIFMIALSMILYVGLRPLSLVLLFAIGIAFSVFSWFVVLKPYQKDRVLTFLNPTTDLAGTGYHQHQAMIAIGGGGALGQGHGQGTQTQLSFLPEQQTDFIFAVWAEEQGFVGCAIVVVLFAALIFLCVRVIFQARDRFGALLAVGVTAMLFWHSVINMLMVLHLAPVVGVPLPFWSNGGSFAITVLMSIGVLMSVRMRRFVF